jgi:uncharacterized protein YggL (DUF469 family)
MYGFIARFRMRDGLDDAMETQLTDAFLRFLGSRGLVTSGGFSGTRWSHVIRSEASQATDADRAAVSAWAANRAEIEDRDIGDIVDLDTLYG